MDLCKMFCLPREKDTSGTQNISFKIKLILEIIPYNLLGNTLNAIKLLIYCISILE